MPSAILLLAVCSCNEGLELNRKVEAIAPQTRAFEVHTFSFDSITRPEVWSTYQTLEEMQRACQVPDSVLATLPTEDLVKVCMDYPLYGIYSAYNDESDGIKVIIDGFNGFDELKKRDDASKALVDCYAAFDADKMVAVMDADSNFESDINPLKLGYLELLLSSDEIAPLIQPNDLFRLAELQSTMLQKQEKQPAHFGKQSLRRTKRLHDKIATQTTGAIIVTTKCGKRVEGLLREEMSDYEMGYCDGYFDAGFPNAIRITRASSTYNCHSYAWNMTDGGTTCWINAESGNSNISNYWTKDYYKSTTENEAVKINYPSSDHSAVNYGNGKYASKWGNCAVMIHAPEYGPYSNMNIRNYYRHDDIRRQLVCSNGNGDIEVGQLCTFSIPFDQSLIPVGSKVRKEWTVTNAKGDEAMDSEVTLSETGTGVAQIRFNKVGFYDIYYTVSVDKGEQIIQCYFEAVVLN